MAVTVKVPTISSAANWDRITIKSADKDGTWFSNTGGPSDKTSLTRANEIPTEVFVVKGFELSYEFGSTQENVGTLCENGYFQLRLQEAPVAQYPMRSIPAFVALGGIDNRGTGATQVSVQPTAYGRILAVTQEIPIRRAQRLDAKFSSGGGPLLGVDTDVALVLHGVSGQLKIVQ